jgi:IMP dehydrogenase/GMP reductase
MYSLDEVGLIPAKISKIKHREDVNPCVKSPFGGNKLPVFVAPMTCIVDANNICTFSQSMFEPILPVVSADLELRTQLPNGCDWVGWTAMTFDEFKHHFNFCNANENRKHYVLIDVANGHMEDLFKAVKDAKQEYGKNLTVMIGNIANPKTYIECCKAGVDYVRVGIGGGSGCTTSVQTGIHASMPWLLTEIKRYKQLMSIYEKCTEEDKKTLGEISKTFEGITSFRTKVIADGGIDTIAKAIKCLALGADYVMMGKCFVECIEGTTQETAYKASANDKETFIPHHLYYGQSSKLGQKDRFGKAKSNPEGLAKWIPVTTNLKEFTDKFEAALRSAMSYCGAATLDEFIGKVQYEYMSASEFGAYIK